MKIYAISLVKNEADIIEKNLLAASQWCDKIFVFDNGSTDGTWEIVNSLKSDKIIPLLYSAEPYQDFLRQRVFEHFRHELQDGDWICFKLDADEFYIDDPRTFLSGLGKHISLVYGANIEYQFTEDNLEDATEEFSFDKFTYALIPTCEQRFVKYRKKLVWNEKDSLPIHPGVPSKKFIKFAHYQFRNPGQIKKRLATRKKAVQSGYKAYWDADLEKTWEGKIIPKEHLIKVTPTTDLDKIIKEQGLVIPETPVKRIIKLIMHGLKLWP